MIGCRTQCSCNQFWSVKMLTVNMYCIRWMTGNASLQVMWMMWCQNQYQISLSIIVKCGVVYQLELYGLACMHGYCGIYNLRPIVCNFWSPVIASVTSFIRGAQWMLTGLNLESMLFHNYIDELHCLWHNFILIVWSDRTTLSTFSRKLILTAVNNFY